MNYSIIDTNNKISSYDSCLQKMNKNLSLNVSKIMSRLSSTDKPLSPKSILFSNRMKKYKDEHNILPIKVCLEDNVEWEMPAFVIIKDTSILGHKRIYSTVEKKLKLDLQDNIVYNMLSMPLHYHRHHSPHPLKREFSIVYEPCTLVINSEIIKFNRLSYAKIADYCSLNYPKSVKRAYKELLILWTRHIEEYPEYWEGFDVKHMRRIYNNEVNRNETEDDVNDSDSESANM